MSQDGGSQLTTSPDEPYDDGTRALVRSGAIVWGFPEYRRPVSWLGDAEQTIGRDSACSIQLSSEKLSRTHARLRPIGRLWIVEDCQSRNGVFVNAERVERTVLANGDVLRLGDWIGVYRELAPTDRAPFLESEGLLCGPSTAPLLLRAQLLAPSTLPIVIQGATGTGKELFARAIHAASARHGAFVAVNCASYQRATAPAELFGYRRGAFTGADRSHQGHIQAADSGTLFLDEVSELDLDVQAQLLRAIQEGEVQPLGASRPVRVETRFITATQTPFARQVERGGFREDLRARLEGAVLQLPPLSERREEVAPLFLWLAEQEAGVAARSIDPKLVEHLVGYAWPLNVRELALLVRKLCVLHRAGTPWTLTALRAELPARGAAHSKRPQADAETEATQPYSAEDVRTLLDALELHRGNVSRAAADLNISRQRAYRILKQATQREP